MLKKSFMGFLALFIICLPAHAAEVSKVSIEIFRIAPGQHEAFLRYIDMHDEAHRRAGLPPRDLYVHADGQGWDFIVIKPYNNISEEKQAAKVKALEDLGAPKGINAFIAMRQFIADHDDAVAVGPTTARDYLSGLDKKD